MSHHNTPQHAQEAQEAPQFPNSASPDTYHVATVLMELDAVPRDELPDGGARDALAEAIRAGVVDGVYRPACSNSSILTLTICEPDEDCDRTIADWIAAWNLSRKWHSAALAVWADDVAEGGAG